MPIAVGVLVACHPHNRTPVTWCRTVGRSAASIVSGIEAPVFAVYQLFTFTIDIGFNNQT